MQFDTLEELYLNLNSLSGPIPEEFTELTSLEELDLEVNSLSGDPFDVLTQMNTLTRLRISSNDFSGMIPPAIQNLSRLVELWLAGMDIQEKYLAVLLLHFSSISVSFSFLLLMMSRKFLFGTLANRTWSVECSTKPFCVFQ